jgi:uncharacterized protein (TIGR03000 family)
MYGYNYDPSDQGYSSFYSGPQESSARIQIHCPPDATVYFDGERTTQQGELRRFVTPSLEPGQDYHYEIRAVWDENGRRVDRVRKVEVAAGELRNVDFLAIGGRARSERTDYDRDRNHGDYNRDQTRDRDRLAPPPEPIDRNKPPTF